MSNETCDILKSIKLQHKIKAYKFIFDELKKSEKRLEKQIKMKESELIQGDKVYMVVPVKNLNGTIDEYEIHNADDLLELWQFDVLTNKRLYEKYEMKLDSLMKSSKKEKDISDSYETLKILNGYIENLAYDIKELIKEEKE